MITEEKGLINNPNLNRRRKSAADFRISHAGLSIMEDSIALTTRFNVDRACCGADVRDNINTAVRPTPPAEDSVVNTMFLSATSNRVGVDALFYQLQSSIFPGWGSSSLEPCQTPTRLDNRQVNMNQQQNAISLARVNISGFPGWEISSLEPRQTPTRFF